MTGRQFPHRQHIDPSQTPTIVRQSMVALAVFTQQTGQPNLKAGIEVEGRFYAIEVTEVQSKEELERWNGAPKQ